MIRSLLLSFASMIALGASAADAVAPSPRAALLTARLLKQEAVVGEAVVTVAASMSNARHLAPAKLRPSRAVAPWAGVEAAKRSALREPERDSYVGAIQVYPWIEGTLYRLYTAPGQVSDIALQPGETLNSVAAGDTARWVIGDTSSGAGAGRRTHILVKPSAAGLSTNLLIATDRRVYHVQLESSAKEAMASISWTYPEDALLALKVAAAAGPAVAAEVTVEALNFNYRIEGDSPPWRPLRAFDDGRQLFIEFPPTLPEGEAPPLFVRGDGGRAELVNYRLRGRYYVVDRLFSEAELRLGGKSQQVVRIVRDGEPRRRAS